MILVGLVLLVLGLATELHALLWLGVVLLIVGILLNLTPIGGRRYRVW